MRTRFLLLKSLLVGIIGIANAGDNFDENYRYAVVLMGERGEYAAAAEKFAEITRSDPQNPHAPQALYYLANCYLRLKKEQAAAESFAQIYQLYPENPLAADALAYGADAYLRCSLLHKAWEMYNRLLEKFPQCPHAATARYWRAECGLQIAKNALTDHNSPESDKFYRNAVTDMREFTKHPHALVPDALLNTGLAAFARQDYPVACEFLKRYNNDYPTHDKREEGLLYQAESAYWQKNLADAAAAYNQLRGEFPNGKYKAEALSGLGWCAYEEKKFRSAAEFFAEAAQRRHDPIAAGNDHYNAGVAFSAARENRPAEKEFLQVVNTKEHPQAVAACIRLGNLFRNEKNPQNAERAEQYYAEALRLSGNNPAGAEAAAFLGEIRGEQKKNRLAIAAFQEGWNKWPQSKFAPFSAYHLALAQAEERQYAAAAATLRQLLQRFPQTHYRLATAYLLGDCQLKLGNKEKAFAAWEWLVNSGTAWAENLPAAATGIAQDSAPADLSGAAKDFAARALLRLGDSYLKDNALSAAQKYFERLDHDFPRHQLAAVARFRLGEIAEKNGDTAAAAKNYRVATQESAQNANPQITVNAAYRLAVLPVIQAPQSGEERLTAMRKGIPAIRQFREKFRDHPAARNETTRALYYLAEAEYALKNLPEAQKNYAEYYRLAPRDTLADAALIGLAWCARDTGDLKTAATHCQTILRDFPQSPALSHVLTILCAERTQAKDFAQAQTYIQRLRQEFPKEKSATDIAEAKIRDAQGDYAAAAAILAPYLTATPTADNRPQALQMLSLVYWHQAEPLFAQADKTSARLKDFLNGKKIRELAPAQRREANALRDQWLQTLSQARESENRMIGALECLLKDYPQIPGRAAALLRLGEASYERAAYAQARDYYEQALRLDDRNVNDKAAYRIGWCAIRLAEKAPETDAAPLRRAAEKAFASVCEKYPQSGLAGECAWQVAEIRRAEKDFAAALPLYRRAATGGTDAVVRRNAACAAANCLLEMRKYSAAYDAFKEFLTAKTDSALPKNRPAEPGADAYWGAGYAALMLGAYDEARGYFLTAKEKGGQSEAAAKARYGLGMIEFSQKHWKAAREEFRKVEMFHAGWAEVAALALVRAAAASRELGESASAAKDLQRILNKYAATTAVAEARAMLAKLSASESETRLQQN